MKIKHRASRLRKLNSTRQPMHKSCRRNLIWHRNSFSATNASQPKQSSPTSNQPNALPASWRCPGQPGVALEFFTLPTPFAFGHGCDHPGYVGDKCNCPTQSVPAASRLFPVARNWRAFNSPFQDDALKPARLALPLIGRRLRKVAAAGKNPGLPPTPIFRRLRAGCKTTALRA
jgi:hypothetical protein